MSEEGTTTCYQIVSEDVMSPLEDSPIEHTVEHNGQTLVYEEQPTHTHSYASSSSHSSSSSSGEVQRGWTYEDQFKELYTLSQDPGRKEFLDSLFAYMQQNGTPITRIPIMAKQPLDLYKLYQHVVAKGGLLEVINRKAWRDIAKDLQLPSSITSAAFTLRTQYVKYLYAYECESEGFSKPTDLQTAIDNNKRERRPSELDKIPGQLIIHSPEMAIMRTAELGAARSPLVTSAPIQVLASPTAISLPHGSVPSYPGGIILTTPGKAPMALTQHITTPQLVQVAGGNTPVPLMMPTGAQPPHTVTKVASPSLNHTVATAPVTPQQIVTHQQVVSPQQVVTHQQVVSPQQVVTHQQVVSPQQVVTHFNGGMDTDTQPPSPKRAALEKERDSHSLPSMHINLTPGPYSVWRGSNSSVSIQITVNGVVYEGVLKATGSARQAPQQNTNNNNQR